MSSEEEEANAEALRRIYEAENTEALHLIGLDFLRQLPRELERLISLQNPQPFRLPAAQQRLEPAGQADFAPNPQPLCV
jgi:hypothetical protein